jgi:polar amino acid transport system permease protein
MANAKAAGMTRREAYEAKQRRRSLIVAASSTIAVVAAIMILVPMAPGWEKVQRSFFNGDVLA